MAMPVHHNPNPGPALHVGGVLHSARDEAELRGSLGALRGELPEEELEKWERYGALGGWGAGFDEHPEEEAEAARAGARSRGRR